MPLNAISPLKAISPLDGRYDDITAPLAMHFSEAALIGTRVRVETDWLVTLGDHDGIPEVRQLVDGERDFLCHLSSDFGINDAERVKEIEATTRHDVKAVEYWLKEKLAATTMSDVCEWVHFACTSEDINNLSHALMLKGGIEDAWLPAARELVEQVTQLAEELAHTPMLARTHGQTASPTTLGKELAVFCARWRRQLKQIEKLEYPAKINGAVGNFNAHSVAYPDVDWEKLARRFVTEVGLDYNPLTTQIEAHDGMAEAFHALMRFNNITLDFCRDIWTYISMGYFRQRAIAGEVGSSTMPHKINPIDFENAEANLGLSNALLDHLASKLPISRLQRDLSDSSAIRNVGSALAYSFIALQATSRGLKKLDADARVLARDLDNSWEVLGEAVQTVMRKAGHENPYEKLKELTRGEKINQEKLRAFIETLDLPPADKTRLSQLSPQTYIGLAPQLVRHARGE